MAAALVFPERPDELGIETVEEAVEALGFRAAPVPSISSP